MKKINLKKLNAIFFLIFSCCFFSFGEAFDLNRQTPSWVCILGGNALCRPVRTSYGYVVVGEGKMISAFSSTGALLWQTYFKAKPKPFVSIGLSDMLYVVTKERCLNLLNSSGKILWTEDTGFSITEEPVPAGEGMVFVRGKNNVACYSLKGKLRWNLELKDQDLSLQLTLLPDGSMLVFCENKKDFNSFAKRVSPFGEILEEITFAGKIETIKTAFNGALLSFSDGSIGLCSSNKDGLYSLWAKKSSDFSNSTGGLFILDDKKNNYSYFLTEQKIIKLNTKDGSFITSFSNPKIDIKNISYACKTIQGLVIADKSYAYCFKDNGEIYWKSSLNTKNKWLYAFATDSGYLAFCSTSWGIEAYRVKQSLGKEAHLSSFIPQEIKSNSDFYEKINMQSSNLLGPAINENLYKEIYRAFTEGPAGPKESFYLALVESELNALNKSYMQESWDYTVEKPYFKTNSSYAERVLILASLTGTSLYAKTFSSLVKRTSDKAELLALINAMKELQYDPEGDLLLSLEYIMRQIADPKEQTLNNAICDTVLSICTFMGKPSLWQRGRNILSYMMYPQFSNETREKARLSLEKIIEE